MCFRSRRPTRVLFLTARHKALRLSWTRQHRHWTVDDWKHVAWSDESRFQLNRSDGRVKVWRQPHKFIDLTCQQGTVQDSRGSVMVWGVCIWRDKGPLIRLDTTLIGDRNDNATPHTSRIATEWLREHYSEFRHFRWPPKSPDMNIIEYIWNALKRAVQMRSPYSLTPTDL
ncbi:transposable element Tcb2 transposase [Trichonephila clavipes]|nr:transposable element Tcb2 transposase [Trichonephila clavipes]